MQPPKSFIIIIDGDNEPAEVLSSKHTHHEVTQLLAYYNESVDFGPYTAWEYVDGVPRQLMLEEEFNAEIQQNFRILVPMSKALVHAISTSEVDETTVSDMMRRSMEREEAYTEWTTTLLADPNVLGGSIVYPGTRTTVDLIVKLLQKGTPRHEIVTSYPNLTDADVEFTKIFAERTRGGS